MQTNILAGSEAPALASRLFCIVSSLVSSRILSICSENRRIRAFHPRRPCPRGDCSVTIGGDPYHIYSVSPSRSEQDLARYMMSGILVKSFGQVTPTARCMSLINQQPSQLHRRRRSPSPSTQARPCLWHSYGIPLNGSFTGTGACLERFSDAFL